MRKLNKLRNTFFAGKTGTDLEEILHHLSVRQQQFAQEQDALANDLQTIRNHLSFAIQKVGVVRFNPFDDGGGNFSFTLALLDTYNNGVVITSIHGRQQNRIYAKRITDGQSETTLTDEELGAISIANKNNKQKQ